MTILLEYLAFFMMKFKNYINFFTVVLVFLLTACQTGSVEEVHSTNATITKTTPLTNFVQRIAMPLTAQDDFIDKSSCFMVNFPFEVTVNNIDITLNSDTDYLLVQTIMVANTNDNDLVFIHFPISVTLKDYSIKSLITQSDYDNLVVECAISSNAFGKINCLNINFPITINSYNSYTQIVSSTAIASNQILYTFIANLSSDKFIAINYPITITDSNGQNIVVLNNSQLEDLIKNAVDTCPDNSIKPLDFIQILMNNSWRVSYYFKDNDRTLNYDGYKFAFTSDYKAIATKNGVNYYGTWETKIDDGIRELKIKFESDLLHKLDEDWKMIEFNDSQLRFRNEDDDNENDYLYFEKY
jgi:hypothetical protein